MKVRRLVLSVSVVAAVVAAFTASPVSAASSRHVFPGTRPSWTNSASGTALGSSQRLSAYVWLTPRNVAQRDALAAAVSDPSSASYRQFMTQAQYVADFGPTAAQVNSVSAWLAGSGVHVDSIGAGNAYLRVSGTASAINAAFDTQISDYIVNGKHEQAPSRDLSVPDAVSADVQAVLGLATLGHRTSPAFTAPSGFVNATPCSTYYGEKSTAGALPQFNGQTLPYAVCGYSPSQLRNVYGVTRSGRTGAGQTVAITDAYDSSQLLSDANQYATNRGDQPFASGQFSDQSVNENMTTGSACGGNGWYGEQNLDVEAVHGMAPAANVRYYGAASCYDSDLLAQLNQVVQDNQASIVTNSWGEPTFVGNGFYGCTDPARCEVIDQSLIDAYESVFKQGAIQGIGFYFSSGDSGDELQASGYKHPDWPTGDTWVTSVGGTSLAIGVSGSRLFETGWGTSQWRSTDGYKSWNANVAPFQYGAGGGYSQIFPEPSYQRNVVVSDPTGGRAIPDVAMDADPTTGMLIGITQHFSAQTIFGQGTHYGEYRIGGTSLASPLFAGLEADTQQGHRRIGFANPLIYSLYRTRAYYDVTPQGDLGNVRSDYINGLNADNGIRFSVRTFDQDSSLFTSRGWDDVTGVGSATVNYITGALGGRD